MRSIFLRYKWLFFSIVFFIIAIPIAGFLLSIENAAPTQKPIDLCEQFEKATYPISCEKAVEQALLDTKGNIENITIGSLGTNLVPKEALESSKKEMWRIDIKLEKPFTARNGSQVRSLRIGIPTDGSNAIFRVPIRS